MGDAPYLGANRPLVYWSIESHPACENVNVAYTKFSSP